MRKVYFLFFISLFLLYAGRAFPQEDLLDEALVDMDTSSTATGETVSAGNSIIQINPLDREGTLYSFELRDAEIADVFRILAHDYKLNLLVDKGVQGKVTATLSSVTLNEMLEVIAESQNLVLEKKNNVIKVSPNFITKIFILKYIEEKSIVESMASSGSVESASGSSTTSAETEQTAATGAESSAKTANTVYDLLSDKGIILLGKQPNSVMVIDYPPNLKKVEEYLMAIDQKMISKLFKLKYLKAADVAGAAASASTSDASSAASTTNTTQGS